MQESRSLDKKIIVVTILLIIWVLALSLISPVISKKPDTTGNKFSSDGIIKGGTDIEIYWDKKGTNRVSSIVWGQLEPGTDKNVTLFIMNKDKNQTTLSYHTSNWQPSEIANYLSLTWDYTGQSIDFRETLQVVFTLSVSEDVKTTGNFSFDIIIICEK